MKNLLLVLMLFVPLLGACNIMDVATEADKAAIEAYDEDLANKEVEIAELTAQWQATLGRLDDAMAQVGSIEAEDFKVLVEGAVAATEAAKLEHAAGVAEFNSVAGARNDKIDEIFEKTSAPIIPFVPDALKPFLPLAMLAFKRVRVQLGSTAVNAADALKLATEMEFKKAGAAVLATGKSVLRATTPLLNSELHEQPQEIEKATAANDPS